MRAAEAQARAKSGRYERVDRVPPYYLDDSSPNAAAMDFYVMGDCKDPETNLIPSFRAARALAAQLSEGGAQHEVLLCCDGPESPVLTALRPESVEHLGYDVAGLSGDYWSIVADFPSSAWAYAYRARLNEQGLFGSKPDAENYLRRYVAEREPDSDASFDVVYVTRVRDGEPA